jgi:hypothetical protein
MSELMEVYEMVTKQTEPDLDAWKQQEERQRRVARNRKLGAIAIVAALVIGIAAVAIANLGTRGGGNHTTPADESAQMNPVNSTAEEVTAGFLRAYGAFDVEQAITYLSNDADITGLITSLGTRGVVGTPEEFRLFLSYLEAARFQRYISQPCEVSSSASGTNLHCPLAFHLLGSYQIGQEPFGGGSIDFTVRDGEIARVSQDFETEEFSPQMWEPFAAWVSSTHPGDVAVMYTDETFSGVRLTRESIRLWRERTREYVEGIMASYGPGQADGPSVGTHRRVVDGMSFSFDVPTRDWEQFGTISINKSIVGPQGAEAIIFWTSFPDGELADPCDDLLGPTVGPSAADLAAALATAPGTELVTGPSNVTVGGLSAKHVVITVREDVGCDPGYFYTWQDVRWGALWPGTNVGDTIRVWIVAVKGTRLFIEAQTTKDASDAVEGEIAEIVRSIRFH